MTNEMMLGRKAFSPPPPASPTNSIKMRRNLREGYHILYHSLTPSSEVSFWAVGTMHIVTCTSLCTVQCMHGCVCVCVCVYIHENNCGLLHHIRGFLPFCSSLVTHFSTTLFPRLPSCSRVSSKCSRVSNVMNV